MFLCFFFLFVVAHPNLPSRTHPFPNRRPSDLPFLSAFSVSDSEESRRYLPLTPDDRAAMLAAVGASSIDDLFVDVPAAARLSGPIEGLPAHASELAVERHMAALSRKNQIGRAHV